MLDIADGQKRKRILGLYIKFKEQYHQELKQRQCGKIKAAMCCASEYKLRIQLHGFEPQLCHVSAVFLTLIFFISETGSNDNSTHLLGSNVEKNLLCL